MTSESHGATGPQRVIAAPASGTDHALPSSPLGEAVRRIVDRMDEVARDMVQTYRSEISSYATVEDPLMYEEIRIASRLHAVIVLSRVANGRSLSDDDLATLAELGRRRFAQGFSLPALLRAYRVGTRFVLQRLAEELESLRLPPEDRVRLVTEANTAVFELTSQVGEVVAQAYVDGEREAMALEDRVRRDVIDDLLEGNVESPADVRRRLAALGFVPGKAHAVAVLGLIGIDRGALAGSSSLTRLARAVHSSLDHTPRRPIVTYRNGLVVAVVAAGRSITNSSMARALLDSLNAVSLPKGVHAVGGVGRVETGVAGIRVSYRQAVEALDLVRTVSCVPAVLTHEETLPYALLRGNAGLALQIYHATIEPLVRHDAGNSSDLVRTLDAFLKHSGRIAEAARALQIHRHTLRLRLNKTEQVVGRPLYSREDLLLAELGLIARRLFADEAGTRPTSPKENNGRATRSVAVNGKATR